MKLMLTLTGMLLLLVWSCGQVPVKQMAVEPTPERILWIHTAQNIITHSKKVDRHEWQVVELDEKIPQPLCIQPYTNVPAPPYSW